MKPTLPLRRWTPDEDARLRAGYGTHSARSLAAQLGRTRSAVKMRVVLLGLTKKHNSGTFVPGQTPWNKGMKGLDIGGKATRFKPGHRAGRAAQLYQPIGAERLSKDGYLERKINDGLPLQKRWRAVHLLTWEAANGPLPAGHAVTFKDGNKRNVALDNLILVSRAALMLRNSYHQYGPEIASLVQLRGAITRQINKRSDPHA